MNGTYKGKIGKISVYNGHEVQWSIPKFLSYTVVGHYYESPRFTISGTTWRLRVFPNGETAEDSGWVSLYLVKKHGRDSLPVKARYTFGLKKADGTLKHIGNKITWVYGTLKKGFWYRLFRLLRRRLYFPACGYSRFLERSEWLERKSELLVSETLTLTCTLWAATFCDACGNLSTLSDNFGDLFISKKGADARVKVMNTHFLVHKWVLAARSPVFAAMFEADMKEKKTGLVKIPDFDPETFREFLEFLYSGKIENASCDAFELYRIADKYDVEDLKSECLVLIMTNLSVENVLEAAILGSHFNEWPLILKIEAFFKENYKGIISSAKWDADFLSENAAVANKLLKSIAKMK